MGIKTLLFLVGLYSLLIPLQVVGQSTFNYASAFAGSGEMCGHPLIRTIDDTSALVYYHDNGTNQGYIARIGLALTLRKAKLPQGCTVNDMRITGDNVYFCGHYDTNAVVGHIKLHDFNLPIRTVTLFFVKKQYVTHLNRMVAYEDGGKQKVILVGDKIYTDNSPFPWICPYYYVYFDPSINDYYNFYYYDCLSTLVIDATFNGSSWVADTCIVTGSPTDLEIITEVIETENYVAFVGYFTNHNTTSIHRCNKSSIKSLFYHRYCFWGIDEGHSDYHGCSMKGDTIAVSSLSSYDESGNHFFSTNIRVFDIANMKNTYALRVPLNTKTEPLDLIYMLKVHQLVLLQNIFLPSHGEQCTFLHANPYTTSSTYYAKSWFESDWNKPFQSLSKLRDSSYVAAGGEYWCLKDYAILSNNNCYKVDSVKVEAIPTEKCASEMDTYQLYGSMITGTIQFVIPENEFAQPACIKNF